MVRAFAIALGISTVRLVAVFLDVTLTAASVRPPAVFALSIWIGWALTMGAAEGWIRLSRS